MATDHTSRFGEFEEIREDDSPETKVAKAEDIQNRSNGDANGLNVGQQDLAPSADHPGSHEHTTYSALVGNNALHTTQAEMIAMNAGSNANERGDNQLKILADKKEQREQSMRSAMFVGVGLSAAQALSLNKFQETIVARRELQQEIEASFDRVDQHAADFRNAQTPEERAAAEQAALDEFEAAEDSIKLDREQEQIQVDTLDGMANYFAGSNNFPAEPLTADEMRSQGTEFLAAENPDLASIGTLPEPMQEMLIEARYSVMIERASEMGVSVTEAAQTYAQDIIPTPYNSVAIEAQAAAAGSLVCAGSKGAMDAMSLRSELLEAGMEGALLPAPTANINSAPSNNFPAEPLTADEMHTQGTEFLAAENPDLASIEMLPEPMQEMLIEARYPGMIERASEMGVSVTEAAQTYAQDMTPTAANINSAPSSEASLSISPGMSGADLLPPSSSDVEVTDLNAPADYASVTAYMGDNVIELSGARYVNGAISDGAFHDARTGTVMQPSDPARQPTPEMSANNPINSNAATYKDPLMERMDNGPGMSALSMAS